MIKMFEDILADLRDRQMNGEHMPCPRCGKDRMKEKVTTNALSRYVDDVYICDECGRSEAMLAYMGNPLLVEDWAVFSPKRPEGDFRAVPAVEAQREIERDQLPYLIDLYTGMRADTGDPDLRACRYDILSRCKGVYGIWISPFRVTYRVSEGTLMLRLRLGPDGAQYAFDLMKGGDAK